MENKVLVRSDLLKVDAYRFEGLVRSFPAHFHEYYTIGYMNGGNRRLICCGRKYELKKGDMVLFNPRDSHACIHSGGDMFFSGINIPKRVMAELSEGITGTSLAPRFSENVFGNIEYAVCFGELHENIMSGKEKSKAEEKLTLLVSKLIEEYAVRTEAAECEDDMNRVCEYIKNNYMNRITLDRLCKFAGVSKSTLLRYFTMQMGITPYGYLENIRICEAKKLLEKGMPPAQAALATGFYDQSHFTTYFTRFMGLTPNEFRSELTNDSGRSNNEK